MRVLPRYEHGSLSMNCSKRMCWNLKIKKNDTITDTPEYSPVQLQALTKKAHPTPLVKPVAPIDGHAFDAATEAARFATETAANATAIAEAEPFKKNQNRRVSKSNASMR